MSVNGVTAPLTSAAFYGGKGSAVQVRRGPARLQPLPQPNGKERLGPVTRPFHRGSVTEAPEFNLKEEDDRRITTLLCGAIFQGKVV